MIKIENADVYGFDAAIRGMRNPMNSWDKSDSQHCLDYSTECKDCGYDSEHGLPCPYGNPVVLGKNDLKLMQNLILAGSDHSKFMRYITVTCDITAPLYWYKEYDTYKVGTVANSCSTMHKIHAKEFTRDDFSCEHLVDKWENAGTFKYCMTVVIAHLNHAREKYLETKDKKYWWQMIQLLPSSYNQRRTVQLNYAVLRNMYFARKTHKLDEWRDFCKWVETLPYAKELIMIGDK